MPTETMAQQVIDALAAMADAIRTGTPVERSNGVAAMSSPEVAALRLAQTMESYLNS